MHLLPQDDELEHEDEKRFEASTSLLHETEGQVDTNLSFLPLRFVGSNNPLQSVFARRRLPHDGLLNVSHILRSFVSMMLSLLLALLPRYMRKNGLQPTKKEHVTSYLDALRGWAAFFVLNHHHNPFIAVKFMKQPPFSLLTSGRGMVDVFFVISGYVLSYRMLKLIRTRQAAALLDAMASSVFRRYLRLFGSAAVASFIGMLTVWLGWKEPHLRKPTLAAQLWDWAQDTIKFCDFLADDMPGYWYRGVHSSKYLDPLWTIPVEFKGSMWVFLFCIGSCKLSNKNRMIFCSFCILTCFIWLKTYAALFLGGCLLADLSFTRFPERLPTSPLPQDNRTITPVSQKLHPAKKVLFTMMCIVSLGLLAQPRTNHKFSAWPWPTLQEWIPSSYRGTRSQEHFWLSIGALMLVFSLDSYPTLQTPLKWRISRYLGDISFGIYVMHLLVVVTLWRHILNPWRVEYLGTAMWTNAPNLLIVYAVSFWAADLFIRIDDKVVTAGRWLQTKFFTW